MSDLTDIVDKLREVENCKLGDPFPRCLIDLGGTEMDWTGALSALAKEARIEIERLRTPPVPVCHECGEPTDFCGCMPF